MVYQLLFKMILSNIIFMGLVLCTHGIKLHEHMTKREIETTFDCDHNLVHEVNYEVTPILHVDQLVRRINTGQTVKRAQSTIHFKAFDKNISLYLLQNDNSLLGSNTPLFMAERKGSQIVYNKMKFPVPNNLKLYHDVENRAAITVFTDEENKTHVYGVIGDDLIVKPIPTRLHKEILPTYPEFYHSSFSFKRPNVFSDDPFVTGAFSGKSLSGNIYNPTHHIIIKPKVPVNPTYYDPVENSGEDEDEELQNIDSSKNKKNYWNLNWTGSFNHILNWSPGPMFLKPTTERPSIFHPITKRPWYLPFHTFPTQYPPINVPTTQTPLNRPSAFNPFNIFPIRYPPINVPSTQRPTSQRPMTTQTPSTSPSNTFPTRYPPINTSTTQRPTSQRPLTTQTSSTSPSNTFPTRYPPIDVSTTQRPTSQRPLTTQTPSTNPSNTFPTRYPPINVSTTQRPTSQRPTSQRPTTQPPTTQPPSTAETPSTAKPIVEKSNVVYPELLVTVDYATYDFHGQDIKELSKYMAAFWNAVDLRFRELNQPEIRLNVAGLIVPKTKDSAPYFEKERVTSEAIEAEKTLDAVGNFFANENRFSYDMYDIIVAISKFDLGQITATGQFKSDISGIAKLGGACRNSDGQSVALVRDKGGFNGLITAAHELAHTMGTPHDGDESRVIPGGPCPWSDGYLMSYQRQDSKGMHWSACSKAAMSIFLKGENANCMKNRPNVGTPYSKILPGKLLSRDEQCTRSLGAGWTSDEDYESNCAALYCRKFVSDIEYSIMTEFRPPAEGSYCGKGAICLDAECVQEPAVL